MHELLSRDLDVLAEQFYAGQISLSAEAARYTLDDIAAFFGENMAELAAVVEKMTPEQVAYRLPGAPSGADASGDEDHFDTSEIVTHMASGTAFHWWGMTRALRHERPTFPKPPEGSSITGKTRTGFGTGGWRDISGPELARMLRETSSSFLGYIGSLPEDADMSATSRYSVLGELTAQAWCFLAAMHAYQHLKQVRELQAQSDYPPA
jgi:hypothetical protein